MLPTLTGPGSNDPENIDGISVVSRGTAHVALTPSQSLLAIDEWLFSPTRWHALGAASNDTLPVTVPSLEMGLQLIGKGRVTAIFGRLRPGALVVDIDQPGDFGHFIASEITDWLNDKGIWHLVRPSGGADGRHHIFTAPGDRCEQLKAYIDSLRADLGLIYNDLNARDAVRPLSSPHRHGAVTRPRGDLRDALRGLKRVFPEPPELELGRARKKIPKSASAAGASAADVLPLTLQRYKRDLAPQWRRYLTTGDTSALGSYRPTDSTRSLPEAGLTRELAWAVGDPNVAWALIRESHPAAMVKAKHQGWSWWVKYVWNSAIESAESFSPTANARTAAQPAPEVVAAVEAARGRLEDLMWTQTVRSRPSLLLVGHHVLDRMLTEGTLRVPCPERDLVKNTGLSDRKTIRAALRLLNGPVGQLHTDCLSYLERETTSFEFEIEAVETCSEIPPLRFHPPPTPRGLWATLPRPSHSLWRTLLASDHPLSPSELAVKAGFVPDLDTAPTRSHLASVKKAAVALSHAGMARVDEDGCWSAGTSPRSVRVEERARQAYAVLDHQVETERAAYRETAGSTWSLERARALKKQKTKEKAWWTSLSPLERSSRSSQWRDSFDKLSVTEQSQRKAKLASSRMRAGVNEVEHYFTWLNSLSPDVFLARSLERKLRFQALSQEQRGLAVAAWSRHRARFGLPMPGSSWQSEYSALPDGASERDQLFLERQLVLPIRDGSQGRAVG